MTGILNFLASLLNLPIDKPLALIPLFILEEFGLPLPLVLSGLFTYVGFEVSQGRIGALTLVGVNLLGAIVGSTIIYWVARAGLAFPLWRWGNRLTLGRTSLTDLMSRARHRGSFMVLWIRLSPLPLIITSAGCGILKISYRSFLLGVAISAMLWNAIYVTAGFVAGEASKQLLGTISGPVRYLPLLAVWVIGATVYAISRWRRRRKKQPEQPD